MTAVNATHGQGCSLHDGPKLRRRCCSFHRRVNRTPGSSSPSLPCPCLNVQPQNRHPLLGSAQCFSALAVSLGLPAVVHASQTAIAARVTASTRTGEQALVHSFGPHYGEEESISGWMGSGAIFFGRCNLQCVFCQNWETSQTAAGRSATPDHIALIMLALLKRGCHNINLVSPSQVVAQIISAIFMFSPGKGAVKKLRSPCAPDPVGTRCSASGLGFRLRTRREGALVST